MNSICLFGDSISWGAWDLEGGGWPTRLWKHIGIREGDAYCELYNCSISGGTTQTILDRFESEAKIRGADALMFQTGGNDAAFVPETKSNLVSEDQFRANIETIIERAKVITPPSSSWISRIATNPEQLRFPGSTSTTPTRTSSATRQRWKLCARSAMYCF